MVVCLYCPGCTPPLAVTEDRWILDLNVSNTSAALRSRRSDVRCQELFDRSTFRKKRFAALARLQFNKLNIFGFKPWLRQNNTFLKNITFHCPNEVFCTVESIGRWINDENNHLVAAGVVMEQWGLHFIMHSRTRAQTRVRGNVCIYLFIEGHNMRLLFSLCRLPTNLKISKDMDHV